MLPSRARRRFPYYASVDVPGDHVRTRARTMSASRTHHMVDEPTEKKRNPTGRQATGVVHTSRAAERREARGIGHHRRYGDTDAGRMA